MVLMKSSKVNPQIPDVTRSNQNWSSVDIKTPDAKQSDSRSSEMSIKKCRGQIMNFSLWYKLLYIIVHWRKYCTRYKESVWCRGGTIKINIYPWNESIWELRNSYSKKCLFGVWFIPRAQTPISKDLWKLRILEWFMFGNWNSSNQIFVTLRSLNPGLSWQLEGFGSFLCFSPIQIHNDLCEFVIWKCLTVHLNI